FLGIDLQIGNGRAEHRVPVDQALAAVDEAGVIPPDEHFGHGARHLRVHGEVAALPSLGVGVLPVSGSTEAAHLPRDGGPGLLLPLPDALNKFFAPEIVACLLLEFELALDHDLRSDAGVVGADHPVGVVAAHAVIANERVHQRLLEGVAHVQGAGDVRRRQLDAVRRLLVVAMPEVAGGFPALVPALLDRRRIEALVEHYFVSRNWRACATEAATASRTICVTLTVSSVRTPSSACPSTSESVRASFSSITRSTSGARRASTARSSSRASASSAAAS